MNIGSQKIQKRTRNYAILGLVSVIGITTIYMVVRSPIMTNEHKRRLTPYESYLRRQRREREAQNQPQEKQETYWERRARLQREEQERLEKEKKAAQEKAEREALMMEMGYQAYVAKYGDGEIENFEKDPTFNWVAKSVTGTRDPVYYEIAKHIVKTGNKKLLWEPYPSYYVGKGSGWNIVAVDHPMHMIIAGTTRMRYWFLGNANSNTKCYFKINPLERAQSKAKPPGHINNWYSIKCQELCATSHGKIQPDEMKGLYAYKVNGDANDMSLASLGSIEFPIRGRYRATETGIVARMGVLAGMGFQSDANLKDKLVSTAFEVVYYAGAPPNVRSFLPGICETKEVETFSPFY